MFDPLNPKSILGTTDADLAKLPGAEDQYHEYKSSLTADSELAKKVAKAASGFWNSGGGLLVVGVGNDGKPDGGISPQVRRQPRKEWIDTMLISVAPRAEYHVQAIENAGACPLIGTGKAVFLIAFGPSETGQHMADGRYYIRAGAQTSPAPHFIVESIWARRHFQRPRLSYVASIDNFSFEERWLNIEIVAITDAPALQVKIETPVHGSNCAWQTEVVDRQHPFAFRALIPLKGASLALTIRYRDAADKAYNEIFTVDLEKTLGPSGRPESALDRIANELAQINSRALLP